MANLHTNCVQLMGKKGVRRDVVEYRSILSNEIVSDASRLVGVPSWIGKLGVWKQLILQEGNSVCWRVYKGP